MKNKVLIYGSGNNNFISCLEMDVKMLGQYHKINFLGIRPVKEKPHIES
jgi:hypothetical protein